MATHRIDIHGYCPMGCGTTLSAGASGRISCVDIDCPRPYAVDELLSAPETEHVVEFGESTFTVQHPLRERLDGSLFACPVHSAIAALDGPPVPPGRYRATPTPIDPVSHSVRSDSTGYDWTAL
ncbi:MAG: hypothetical protein JWM93_4004 [Frankiales bacterium]|nr:hypothetical protein [Frankiales bacterium]